MLFKDVRPNEESVERRKPKTTWSGRIGETTKGDYSAVAATRGGDDQETVVSQKPGAPNVSRQERSSASNTADWSRERTAEN